MLCVHHKSSTCVEVKAKKRLVSLSHWRNFYFRFLNFFFFFLNRPRWTGWAAIFLKPPRCVCVCVRPSQEVDSKYVALREIMGCADSKSAGLANTITTVAAASNGQQQHQPSRDHSNFQSKWVPFLFYKRPLEFSSRLIYSIEFPLLSLAFCSASKNFQVKSEISVEWIRKISISRSTFHLPYFLAVLA